MRTLPLVLAFAAAGAVANTVTFDNGALTTVGSTTGWLEDGVFVTGGFQLGDVDGDGSADITVSPAGGDVVFTVLGSAAPGHHFELDLVGNPGSLGPVKYNGGEALFGRILPGHQHLDGTGAEGPMTLNDNVLTWSQNSTWLYAGEGAWRHGGTLTADNITFQALAVRPIPEPETWALMTVGLVAMGLRRRG